MHPNKSTFMLASTRPATKDFSSGFCSLTHSNRPTFGRSSKDRRQRSRRQALADGEKAARELSKIEKILHEKYADIVDDLSIGKPMPAIVSEDLEGKTVSLSDLKGKVVVLDIWTTWCKPCKAMIPHEREMVARLKGQPFRSSASVPTLEENACRLPRQGAHALGDQLVEQAPRANSSIHSASSISRRFSSSMRTESSVSRRSATRNWRRRSIHFLRKRRPSHRRRPEPNGLSARSIVQLENLNCLADVGVPVRA